MFSNKSNPMAKIVLGAAVGLTGMTLLSCGGILRAAPLYFQGFEQNTTGWVPDGTSTVTRYASGATSPVGTINAAAGGYYAVITNDENHYQTGYGDAGYSALGSNTGYANYQGPFTQSVSLYVDPAAWTPPSNPSAPAFWIDMAPSASSTLGTFAGQPLFGGAGYATGSNGGTAENDFAFNVPTAGTVQIDGLDSANHAITAITQTGWYTFAMAYSKGSDGYVHEVLSVYDNSGNLLSGETPQTFDLSPTETNTTDGVPNSDLGGPNYIWFTVWQNGFASNALAIDNVTATPEPTTLALFAIAGAGALLLLSRRKRQAHA